MKDIEIMKSMSEEQIKSMSIDELRTKFIELQDIALTGNKLNIMMKQAYENLKEDFDNYKNDKDINYLDRLHHLNNSIEQRKESNEQLEALHEGWKIELEKKDNRIKELESDKEIKDKMIEMYIEHIYRSCDFDNRIKTKEQIKQYFENLAKESE